MKESVSFSAEDDSDNSSSRKKSKKLGQVASWQDNEKQGPSRESWFDLFKSENTPAIPEKPVAARSPLAEAVPVPEAEAPLEKLGEEEKPVIRAELAEARREEIAEEPVNPEAAAVDDFLEQISRESKDPAAALEQTLAKLDVEPAEIKAAAVETEPEIEAEEPPTDPPGPADQGSAGSPPPPPRESLSPFGAAGESPKPATPDKAPEPETRYVGNPGAALAGGIIGYLIGRRRGRIKTEKRLLPVQKKLEKQVDTLQGELEAKETAIRKIVAEKVTQHGPLIIEVFKRPEKVDTAQRRPAPEANQLHGAQPAERLGHMMVAAESASASKTKQSPEANKPDKKEMEIKLQLPTEKRIETLNRVELLSLSEKIVIDGSTLRQVYETHLVGERGLRRLVAEHLHGGDLHKALRQEVVEREIDFERDPALRDSAPAQTLSGGGSSNPALTKLLEKVSMPGVDENEEAAFFKARAVYEAQHQHQQQQRRKVVDISLAVAITLLVCLVIGLYLSRN